MMDNENIKIAIIGLGYVGLPLTIEFARHFDVIGFDINSTRVSQLNSFYDKTKQLTEQELRDCKVLFTGDVKSISDASVFIITVPTPIDNNKRPDLSALLEASETVASVLRKAIL